MGANSAGDIAWISFRDQPEYNDIFYDSNNSYNYDPTYGNPYFPPCYKKIPFSIPTDAQQWHNTNLIMSLKGILQII